MAWNQLVRNEASTNETDFADIVTVDDAVEDAAAVKVAIKPVQDLHGYDHPWPGGGGKNKFETTAESKTENGVTWTVNEDGTVSVSGTAENYTSLVLGIARVDSSWGTVTISGISSATNIVWSKIALIDDNDADVYVVTGGSANSQFSVDLSQYPMATKIILVIKRNNNVAVSGIVKPMIEIGNAASEWAPYSNICPITGWTGAKVFRSGANLLPLTLPSDAFHGAFGTGDTNITDATNAYCWCMYVGKDTKLYWQNESTGTAIAFAFSDVYMVSRNDGQIYDALNCTNRNNVVLDSGDHPYLIFQIPNVSVFTPETGGLDFRSYMLSFGNSRKTYEPRKNLDTYSIALPTEAGTIYDGELTVNEDGTGTLVVDRKRIVVNQNSNLIGNQNYETSIETDRYINDMDIQGKYNVQYDRCVSNILERQYNIIWAVNDNFLWGFNFNGNQLHMVFENAVVGITDEMTSSQKTQAIKAWLANNNIEIIAPLAAPITYTLTTSQIRTLLGTNNVWADAGQVSLSYTGTDEHLTLKSDRKYFTRISGTDSVLLGSGQEITVAKGTNNFFDLTQMFGTTIADYIYSLETATSGAGVAWFRKLFPKPYYEYNPGELMSVQAVAHKLVGFNAWDEEWELGIINTTTGEETDSNSNIRSKNYIRVIPGATYYFKLGTTDISNNIVFYDAEKNYVAASGEHVNDVFTVPEDAHYMKFYMSTNYGRTYLSNICINLSGNGERDGEYEEYEMHSYPLDSSLILRGIPRLDANNQLYYDGDVYEADGTVTRKFFEYTVTGDENWTIAAVGYIKSDACNAFIRFDDYYNTINIYETKKFSMVNRLLSPSNTGIWNAEGHTNEYALNYRELHLNIANGLLGITDPSQETTSSARNKIKAYLQSLYNAGTPLKFILPITAQTVTEEAEPYDNPQIVASEGTEEYITTNIVFVGHETKY